MTPPAFGQPRHALPPAVSTSRELPRRALIAVSIVACDIAISAAVVEPRLRPLLIIAGLAIGAAVLLRFTVETTIAMLLLTDFIFHDRYFPAGVGGVTAYPFEVILLGLFVVALVRPRRRTWGGGAGLALAAFLALLAVNTIFAVDAARVTAHDAFDYARPFLMLAMFWVVVRLFPDRRSQDQLLTGGAVIGALTGAFSVLLAIKVNVGVNVQDAGGGVLHAQADGSTDLLRVHLPGIALGYMLFWYSVSRLLRARVGHRLPWVLVLAGCTLNIALTFNRNNWVGLALTMFVFLATVSVQLRRRVYVGLGAAVVAGVLMVFAAPQVGQGSSLYPIVQRANTLLAPNSLAGSDTVRLRQRETKIAWETIQKHPLAGVGPGAGFGVYTSISDAFGHYTTARQLFLHNQYLFIALVAGIPGALCFVLFLLVALTRAWTSRYRDTTVMALAAGLVATMVSATVMMYFYDTQWTTAIGIVVGVIVARTGLGPERRRTPVALVAGSPEVMPPPEFDRHALPVA